MKWIEYAWRCDNCLDTVRAPAGGLDSFAFGDQPPHPWREVLFKGWAGGFIVCSDRCFAALEERYARSANPPPTSGLVDSRITIPVNLIVAILTILDEVALVGGPLQPEAERLSKALAKAMGRVGKS